MSQKISLKDFRRTNDGVMIPDLGFKKQLWTLDPELDVVWDWGSSRWEIWRFPGQGRKKRKLKDPRATQVMTIQTKDRSFRELGADIILKLQMGDTQRYSTKQLVEYFNLMDDNIQRKKRSDFLSKIHAITLDTFNYARGILQIQVPKRFQSGIPISGPGNTFKMGRALKDG